MKTPPTVDPKLIREMDELIGKLIVVPYRNHYTGVVETEILMVVSRSGAPGGVFPASYSNKKDVYGYCEVLDSSGKVRYDRLYLRDTKLYK